MGPLVVVLAILAIFFFIFAASAIRIVQPYQRGVKERLGKYHETLDPGLRMIVPFVDKIRLVDMREQAVDVPPQEVITADNVVVSVDAAAAACCGLMMLLLLLLEEVLRDAKLVGEGRKARVG